MLAPVSATIVAPELPDPFHRSRVNEISPPSLTPPPATPHAIPANQKLNPAPLGTMRVTHQPTLPDSGPSSISVVSSHLADPFTVLVVDDDPMTRTLLSK